MRPVALAFVVGSLLAGAPAAAITVIHGTAEADGHGGWLVSSDDYPGDYFGPGKTRVTFTIDNGALTEFWTGVLWTHNYSYFEAEHPLVDNGDHLNSVEGCTSQTGLCFGNGPPPPDPDAVQAAYLSDFSFDAQTASYTFTRPVAGGPCDGTFYVRCNERYRFSSSYIYHISAPGPVNYTVTYDPLGAVPEPASWAMMIAGFGLTGASLRRGRSRTQVEII